MCYLILIASLFTPSLSNSNNMIHNESSMNSIFSPQFNNNINNSNIQSDRYLSTSTSSPLLPTQTLQQQQQQPPDFIDNKYNYNDNDIIIEEQQRQQQGQNTPELPPPYLHNNNNNNSSRYESQPLPIYSNNKSIEDNPLLEANSQPDINVFYIYYYLLLLLLI